MLDIHELLTGTDDGVELAVHATAGAGRSEVVGRHGDALKVRVAAPPEAGRANEAIATMLARQLGVKPSAVTLLSGAKGRSKRYAVAGIDVDAAADRLEDAFVAGGRKGPRPRR